MNTSLHLFLLAVVLKDYYSVYRSRCDDAQEGETLDVDAYRSVPGAGPAHPAAFRPEWHLVRPACDAADAYRDSETRPLMISTSNTPCSLLKAERAPAYGKDVELQVTERCVEAGASPR